jgi:hypothetical protein
MSGINPYVPRQSPRNSSVGRKSPNKKTRAKGKGANVDGDEEHVDSHGSEEDEFAVVESSSGSQTSQHRDKDEDATGDGFLQPKVPDENNARRRPLSIEITDIGSGALKNKTGTHTLSVTTPTLIDEVSKGVEFVFGLPPRKSGEQYKLQDISRHKRYSADLEGAAADRINVFLQNEAFKQLDPGGVSPAA